MSFIFLPLLTHPPISFLCVLFIGWWIAGYIQAYRHPQQVLVAGEVRIYHHGGWWRLVAITVALALSLFIGGITVLIRLIPWLLLTFVLSLLWHEKKWWGAVAIAIVFVLPVLYFRPVFSQLQIIEPGVIVLEVTINETRSVDNQQEIVLGVLDHGTGEQQEIIVRGTRWGVELQRVDFSNWVFVAPEGSNYRVATFFGVGNNGLQKVNYRSNVQPVWDELEQYEGTLNGLDRVERIGFDRLPVENRTYLIFFNEDGQLQSRTQ